MYLTCVFSHYLVDWATTEPLKFKDHRSLAGVEVVNGGVAKTARGGVRSH